MHKIISLLAAAAALSAGTAHALAIPSAMASTSNSDSQTGFSVPTDIDPVVLTLTKFNQQLGTLNGVTLTFSGELVADYLLQSDSPNSQQVTGRVSGKMTFTLPDGSTFDLELLNSLSPDLGPGASVSGLLSAVGGGDLQISTNNLAAFFGPGTFGIGVSNSDANWFQQGTALSWASGAETTGKAKVTVTYDYTANRVPEPASLALVGLALAAAGIARRRQA